MITYIQLIEKAFTLPSKGEPADDHWHHALAKYVGIDHVTQRIHVLYAAFGFQMYARYDRLELRITAPVLHEQVHGQARLRNADSAAGSSYENIHQATPDRKSTRL